MSNRNLLVVDDSLVFRKMAKKILEKYGFEVELARDGKEALDKIASNKPNVVLMDLEMPEMNGFEAIQKIRANPETKDLPVLVVSAKSSPEDLALAEKLPIAAYLTKPLDEERLINEVRSSLPPKTCLEKPEIEIPEGMKDPIYIQVHKCLVCGEGDIEVYNIKAKTYDVDTSYLQVPVYIQQGDFIDTKYHYFQTPVCPNCLCAGTEYNFFAPEESRAGASMREKRLFELLEKSIGDRMQIIGDLSGEALDSQERRVFFKRMRTEKAAIVSILLDVSCQEALEPKAFKSQNVRIASTWLKAAYFYAAEKEEEKEMQMLDNSLDRFLKANDEGASLRVNFFLALIYIRKKDKNKAKFYLSEMNNSAVDFTEKVEGNTKAVTFFVTKGRDLLDMIKMGDIL